MKKTLSIIYGLFLLTNCLASDKTIVEKQIGEFDEIWLILLPYPEGTKKQLVVDNQLNPKIGYKAVKLREEGVERFVNILNNRESYEDVCIEMGLYLYSFIFVKDSQVTNILKPNLAGGDFGITPWKGDYTLGWSNKGVNKLNSFVQWQMASLLNYSFKTFPYVIPNLQEEYNKKYGDPFKEGHKPYGK